MSLTHATHLAKQSQNLEATIIWKCTSKLRNYTLLSLESVPMTELISLNSIIKGEIDPPRIYSKLFKSFIYRK